VRWILLDVVLALLSLALLALVARGVWRRGKGLTRELGRAGELVSGASLALSAPPTATGRVRPPDGRRSHI